MNINGFLQDTTHLSSDARISIEDYLVVSEEGFFQAIGDVFRNFRHGRPPQLTNDKGGPKINRKVLETTYLNPEWLAKRRFVEGEVKVGQNAKGFLGDWNAAMRKLADAYLKSYQANLKIMGPYYEKVKPGFAFVDGYKYKDAKNLEKFLATFDLKFTPPKFNGLGTEFDVSKEGATLPALTQEQVVKLTNTIIYMCDAFFRNSGLPKGWQDSYGTTLNRRWYLYSNTGAKLVADSTYPNDVAANRDCFTLINSIYDYTARFEAAYYKRSCVGWNSFQLWLKGALAWIDASVK